METFQVTHSVENGISPVDLVCTYSTVYMPQTPNIVWLDRNLGAITKQNSASDKRSMSRGLFFQFGNKQGYLYDGQRIPNTEWDNFIMEDSNWPEDQNPCIELGDGWRLPTKEELEAIEEWGTWVGAWNSPLKLHAAGWLYTNGILRNAGSNGCYWSSSQAIPERGFMLNFNSGVSKIYDRSKAYGLNIRPVKDI